MIRPWAPRVVMLLLAASMLALPGRARAEFPPVRYSGYLQATASQASRSGQGDDVVSQRYDANLNLYTYIWQPWFATTDGGFTVSQAQTEGETDATSELLAANARLRVFPTSRFPFEVYGNVSDTRADVDDPFGITRDSGDVRSTLVRVQQQYRPTTGDSRYLARYEHDSQDTERLSGINEGDRLQLESSHQVSKHSYAFNASVDDRRLGEGEIDTELQTLLLNARHSYRPTSHFSLQNYASFVDFDLSNALAGTQRQALDLSSAAAWRSRQRPLRVTGDARYSSGRTETGTVTEEVQDTDLSMTAYYELTPELRASGRLRSAFVRRGESDSDTHSQSGTLSYSPAPFDVRGFSYSWSTAASATNAFSSEGDDTRTAGLTLSHGLNRSMPFGPSPTVLNLALSQSVSATYSDPGDSTQGLTTFGSLGLVRALGQSSSQLVVTASDSRSLGGSDDTGSLQSINLSALHNRRIGRHINMSAGLTLQSIHREDGSFDFSSADLSYRNSRLFGVRRLQFLSELSLNSSSLNPLREGRGDVSGRDLLSEKAWENELTYNLGRLGFRLRAVATERGSGNRNYFVLFSVVRNIGGIF